MTRAAKRASGRADMMQESDPSGATPSEGAVGDIHHGPLANPRRTTR